MMPQLFHKDAASTLVIAHRGASAGFPENTMAAFRGAVQMQADMIELDVQLSKDGVPVVFHDAVLNHHSDGKGPVKKASLSELKTLDAGSWFNSEFTDERIPTLEEVLQFARGTIALNIEIKTEAVSDALNGGAEEKCLALVRKYKMEQYVLFSSFDYRAVKHLKELAPEIPVAVLYEKKQSQSLLPSEILKKYKADAFNCSYGELNTLRLNNLKEHGIPFFIYTVDSKSRMKKLLEEGAAGIFTNKPAVLRSLIENWNLDSNCG